ncbi:MAG: hypothetical protein V4580_03945 [Bacteroidota bacterium]
MNYIFVTFSLLMSLHSYSQIPDTRAELEIKGRISEISVAPDESIWLVSALGKTYYTESINSNWHYGVPLFEDTSEYNYSAPHLNRVSFFNKDTAIISGYISSKPKDYRKDGYYLTHDGGKSWQLLNYGGDAWIYAAAVNKTGQAWLGGMHKRLYYSENFGSNWRTIDLPYTSSDRVYSIFMTNSMQGIIGSDANEIIQTNDNWKTAHTVATPFDQKNKKKDKNIYSDDRISQILIWNNYIVANQAGHIYFTDKENIDWKEFPVDIIEFELDIELKKLYAVTADFKIISFTTPDKFEVVNDGLLKKHPMDMQVSNGSLYLIDSSLKIYKITAKGYQQAIPYTTDHKIAVPDIIKKANTITWGASGAQIYLSKNDGKEWYRENALPFGIHDFKLQDDSTAILWNGTKDNYLYSLKDHKAVLYTPHIPINDFLKNRIIGFDINSGSRGCYHHVNYTVNYKRVNDSLVYISDNDIKSHETNPETFHYKTSSKQLDGILSSINLNPTRIPTLKEFYITADDKKNYVKLVNSRIRNKDDNDDIRISKEDKDYYYSVSTKLDTISNSIIGAILDKNERIWSTTSNWFTMNIVNEYHDTLHISRNYYVNTLPWNLPWKIEYKGLNFNCYDIELSRFIKNCIPDNFMDKEVFDNKLLIMQIADYLKK